jgi:HemY protein
MLRVVLFLILVGVLALAGAWLADRPGDVAITWMGWRIETSVLVAVAAVAVTTVLALVLWSIARLLLHSPRAVSTALQDRRRRKGYLAISRGLVAIGAGDVRAARKFAGEAGKIAPDEPLALLLQAQTAQLSGDRAAAEEAFRAMAEHEATRSLGLRGLYVEAQRRDDRDAARTYAEAAAQDAPALPWAGQAVLEFRCAEADWDGALAALEASKRSRGIDAATYRRHRAVLLTARALALEENDSEASKTAALEAAKLAPDLVPAAALAGRLLAETGATRRAARLLEKAWRLNPHPELAEVYAHLRSGDSARERLARIEVLARQSPGQEESMLAVARAAIEAHEFVRARSALAPLLRQPTQRVAMLMAELEEAEHGDEGRAREWMGRAVRAARDPAWTADGMVSDRWMPVSPVSGRLDAFEWRVPLAELARDAGVIEEERRDARLVETPAVAASLPASAPAEAAARPAPAAAPVAAEEAGRQSPAAASAAPAAATAVAGVTAASAAAGATAAAPAARAPEQSQAAAPPEKIIPLVHAPDDPGPEPDAASVEELTEGQKRRFPVSFR